MTVTITQIVKTFRAEQGFDPYGIYCQFTGQRIGSTLKSEMDALLGYIGGSDADDIADDLAMRILASMRPSIRWNKMRAETLQQLRVTDPVGTMAYLMNRLFAPLNHRKTRLEDLLSSYRERIEAHAMIQSWGKTDESHTIFYMLLELDAKWNLDTEYPPFSFRDFADCESMLKRIELLQAWYDRRVEAYTKKVAADEMQVRWSRSGNTLAKPAFLDLYCESKPLTKVGMVKAAKQEERDLMAGLLSEIMMERVTVDQAIAMTPKPVLVPITKMPRKFGVK